MKKPTIAIVLASWLLVTSNVWAEPYVPVQWTSFVNVEGQSEPIPERWLDTDEARIAHSLKLPDSVPKPAPFDFDKGGGAPGCRASRRSRRSISTICARAKRASGSSRRHKTSKGCTSRGRKAHRRRTSDPYGPEMPWTQRIFILQADKAHDQGTWFIQPPIYNYRFVEQPRRDVKWQAGIAEPYIRLFGYTREVFVKEGQVVAALNEKAPMQVIGVSKPTARYGYTWRGVHRARDREFGIAGGEVLIYDLQTKEVLAARRQFLIAFKNPKGPGKAMWEIAARCSQLRAGHDSGEFTQFAFDVLQTIEPSTTRGK